MKEKDAGMQTWVDAQVRQGHNVRSAKSNQTVTANQDQHEQRRLEHETRKTSECGLAVSEPVSDPDEETTSPKTPPKNDQPVNHEDGQAEAEHPSAKESFMAQNRTTEQLSRQSNQSPEGSHRGTPEPLLEQLDQSSEDIQEGAPEPLLEQVSQASEDMQNRAPESLWGQSSQYSVDATDLTTPDTAREDRPDMGSSDSPNDFAGPVNNDGSQSTTNKSELRDISRSVERYEWWDE